jgi:hypothetical protein
MQSSQPKKASRRGFVLGAATAGAAVAAFVALPKSEDAVPPPTGLAPPPERGGGYQLSEHVKKYYSTTRI